MNRALYLILAAALVGCPPPPPLGEPDDTDTQPLDDMPLVGEWVDNYDGNHIIDEASWSQGDSVFHLTAIDAADGWAVAENDAGNDFNPGLWSRFDWTAASHNGWWICQTAFDAATEDDAVATPAADDADPTVSGCGGFAWTRLYTPLPLRGSWVDGFGGDHDVREWAWVSGDSTFHVVDYDATAGWLIAQNDAANPFNPELWSRFEWTRQDDAFWFCQVAYDAVDEAAARAAGPADTTDPATSGCGGFAWSSLSPAN